jgi:hypothetical protein
VVVAAVVELLALAKSAALSLHSPVDRVRSFRVLLLTPPRL